MKGRRALWFAPLLLTGCAPLQSPMGRMLWLVLVPVVIIAAGLYLLRRRAAGKGGRGPHHPDHDERE